MSETREVFIVNGDEMEHPRPDDVPTFHVIAEMEPGAYHSARFRVLAVWQPLLWYFKAIFRQ